MKSVLQGAGDNGFPSALLDDVGKAIVEQLQEDGRRPYATIARRWGSPRPPCGSGSRASRRRA